MKLTPTLALLLLATSASLALADPDPNRERRAPAASVPATWGTKTIRGASVPFGQWELSTQCTHNQDQQSAIELDWDSTNLPSGSSVTLDVVARPGNKSKFPRDTFSFYVWADGKMLESSKGQGVCPSNKDPATCLTQDGVSRISSFPIPWGTKRLAILPVGGKCQQTLYRLKTKVPGTCGSDEFRIPTTKDGVRLVLPKDAKAACSTVNGGEAQLAHTDWHNIKQISSVAFDCLGPNGKALVATWNGDDFDLDAVQVFLGSDKTHTASVNEPDGTPSAPICATVREETFGQESSTNLRVVTRNQGMLREEAFKVCTDNGYGALYSPWNGAGTEYAKDKDLDEALAMIRAAAGNEGAAWIQTPDQGPHKGKCVALSIDENNSFDGPVTEEPKIKGDVVDQPCDAGRLTAVVCVKTGDAEIVRMLRSAE
ncbi:hypothetical protein BCR44DRAFT_34237 [Catenaria anguillulae PL171]|uniref:Uncharacterized protein n=1 Tax=Catenaria anguillulae PL171 TaxID=765915 RepID=A0A1Y2HL58_9FUNG|nr:hypothetical protein BCR44DRAFT_34237 [Catenaria anguillulae PL171]